MACGANIEGLELLNSLTSGLQAIIPYVDVTGPLFQLPTALNDHMYQPVTEPSFSDLASGVLGGTGTFDQLMASVNVLLRGEFEKNRITGAEYTKAYIALAQSAMQTSMQFMLSKQQAFWQAQQSQIAAIAARVQLETARVEHAKAQTEAETAEANFGLVTLKIANESQQFCVFKFQLEELMPYQALLVKEQTEVQRAQTLDARSDSALVGGLIGVQKAMLGEQKEAQRAQTLDARTDSLPVTGLMGKQKALYTQQITSYERDAQTKAAKLFTDAWITQKTIDEGLTAPAGFTNSSVDTVLAAVKLANNLT